MEPGFPSHKPFQLSGALAGPAAAKANQASPVPARFSHRLPSALSCLLQALGTPITGSALWGWSWPWHCG